METEEERKARLENERILLHPCRSEQGKVIVVGVHIYICSWTNKYLNRTLAIDSPFQKFVVRLLADFLI